VEDQHRDRLDIIEVLHRYADGYDRRDDAVVGQCYVSGARFASVTPVGDVREFLGVDDIRSNARNTFRNCPHPRRHVITNELVTLDGDNALATCYLTLLEITPDGIAVILTGRYDDRLVRTAAGWRIDERVLHSDVEFSIPRS
jgi:ketosteroid isomerase-like protein